MLNLLQSGLASAERVFALLDEPEEKSRPGRRAYARPDRTAGSRSSDVSFSLRA